VTKRKPRDQHRPNGRPTDYRPEFVEQAAKLCALAATDRELADFFGVTVTTLNRWKRDHPEFCASIKVAKAAADDRVERSLYERAVGYSYDSEKIFMPSGRKRPVRVQTTEHVPPEVTAQRFWLINRRRDHWRERQDHTHDVSDTLAEALAKARKRAGARAKRA
jgi:hypothetical protein